MYIYLSTTGYVCGGCHSDCCEVVTIVIVAMVVTIVIVVKIVIVTIEIVISY